MTGLENGKPGLGGDAGDTSIRRERSDVKQLADTTGTELDEALERGQILNVKDLSYIPLQIGANVVLNP